jgi:hypothetical protein
MASTTEKFPVQMEDGSTVEFTTKQRLVKTTAIDEETGKVSVRLDFRNGAVRHFTIPDSLMLKFAGHGAEQKLGDAIAGEDDLDDAVEAVSELIVRLEAGEWSAKREKGASKGQSILLRAMVEAYAGKRTADQCRAFLATKTPQEKRALRTAANLAPIIARLESEKASKRPAVDVESLLEGF